MSFLRRLVSRSRPDRRGPLAHRLSLTVQALEGRALMSHVPALSHLHEVSILAKKPKNTTFVETGLISDNTSTIPAAKADPNLVNPWGIVASPTGPFWFADNHSGLSTLATGAGVPQSLVVTIPPPAGSTSTASPTGIVLNSTPSFVVSSGSKSSSGVFIFATEDGTISAWSPKVDATHAILAVDNSASGAVYKGLALAAGPGGNQLYASNFNTGKIDVFDSSFKPVTLAAGAFHDAKIPKGFAPFNITTFGSDLLVTYAKQDKAKHDDARAPATGSSTCSTPAATSSRGSRSAASSTRRGEWPWPRAASARSRGISWSAISEMARSTLSSCPGIRPSSSRPFPTRMASL